MDHPRENTAALRPLRPMELKFEPLTTKLQNTTNECVCLKRIKSYYTWTQKLSGRSTGPLCFSMYFLILQFGDFCVFITVLILYLSMSA